MSSSRADTAMTTMTQLSKYNITVDEDIALPEPLADFVQTLKQGRDEEPSPHAQAIINTWKAASMANEFTGQKMLDEHILFRGEAFGGTKGLTLKDKVNLVKDYLPDPPNAILPELRGSFSRPQPDSCIGYITAAEANTYAPPSAPAFTAREDEIARLADTHFPFLTAQWKAVRSGENQFNASLQAARDGALIVNYMHNLYSTAYPDRAPTQLETCHFSLTIDGCTIILWIHWREIKDGEVYFRMEVVDMARMRKLDDLLEVRKILHNYVDYALGERLRSIKGALPAFYLNRPRR
ncbi:hypothetical protein N0V90_013248 [Kalmusia sp. IMI 367209]|nr:hypothetical protein N0V90_013248 [Kalmusia sp. IMI 367209]